MTVDAYTYRIHAYHVSYYVSTSIYDTNQSNVGKYTYHTWILLDN